MFKKTLKASNYYHLYVPEQVVWCVIKKLPYSFNGYIIYIYIHTHDFYVLPN